MKRNISIVLGAGFGDEGKGSQVNFLAKQSEKPLVIRFSGGHQVGHTVVVNGKRHVFSNFGSGTIHGAPTYWSEYCTFNPIGIQREAKDLESQGVVPRLYLDANAMVTTPFDMLRNKELDKSNKHGSVGVGFGQTVQRTEDHYTLFARDLRFPAIRDAKLDIIRRWYGYQNTEKTIEVMNEFRTACDYVVETHEILNNGLQTLQDYDWIFEGSQGIMLDMDYGFFPHVTRSNTTTKNALEIIRKYKPDSSIRTFYMTRAYQTRHGNGPMTNQNLDNDFITDNPLETNRSDGFQGEFRKSPLDLDMLKYAIECDSYHNLKSKRILVITCLDQVPERIPVTINNGELVEVKWKEISTYVNPIMESWGVWSEEGYKYPWELEKQEINE